MRLVVLLLLAGCRLAFDDLGRAATTDAGADVGVEDDVLVATGPRVVQSTAVLSVDAFAPNTVTFPMPTTAGNTIVTYSWTWSSQGPCLLAPTDAAGNTYTEVRKAFVGGACAGGTGEVAIHVAASIAASAAHQVTLERTVADNTAQYALVAVEYAGLSASPLVDATSSVGSSASPNAFTTGAVTTVAADTLLVSAATICGGFPDDVVWSATDLTMRGVEARTNGTAPGAGGDRLASQPGDHAQSWTVTFSGGPAQGIGVAAALR